MPKGRMGDWKKEGGGTEVRKDSRKGSMEEWRKKRKEYWRDKESETR